MSHEERMKNLCTNLYCLRRSHGLTQKEMAKILGIGVRTLSAVEGGTVPKRLGSSALVSASEYFQVSVDALFLPMGE